MGFWFWFGFGSGPDSPYLIGAHAAKMIKDLKGITGRDYNPRGVVDREAVEVLAELYGIPLVDMAKELDVYQRY